MIHSKHKIILYDILCQDESIKITDLGGSSMLNHSSVNNFSEY